MWWGVCIPAWILWGVWLHAARPAPPYFAPKAVLRPVIGEARFHALRKLIGDGDGGGPDHDTLDDMLVFFGP